MQTPVPFEIWSGFESTRIVCPDRPLVDVLELTHHLEHAEEDLRLVRAAGLRWLRLMLRECERLAARCREAGARFLRAGRYPFVDSTD